MLRFGLLGNFKISRLGLACASSAAEPPVSLGADVLWDGNVFPLHVFKEGSSLGASLSWQRMGELSSHTLARNEGKMGSTRYRKG